MALKSARGAVGVVTGDSAKPATFEVEVARTCDYLRLYFEVPSDFDSLTDEQRAELYGGPVPKEKDLKDIKNRVSSVKNQGDCRACWAFTTAGILEGQRAVRIPKLRKLIPLSAQQLLDFSGSNSGCAGGFMHLALDDLADDLGGIKSEVDYPFSRDCGEPENNTADVVMTAKGGFRLPQDEEILKKVVANYGPVGVIIDVDDPIFATHKKGVYSNRNWCSLCIDHAMLVVGYGTDPTEGDFWILKNSWGRRWGDKGFIKIKRGVNICGITNFATIDYR